MIFVKVQIVIPTIFLQHRYLLKNDVIFDFVALS